MGKFESGYDYEEQEPPIDGLGCLAWLGAVALGVAVWCGVVYWVVYFLAIGLLTIT